MHVAYVSVFVAYIILHQGFEYVMSSPREIIRSYKYAKKNQIEIRKTYSKKNMRMDHSFIHYRNIR